MMGFALSIIEIYCYIAFVYGCAKEDPVVGNNQRI